MVWSWLQSLRRRRRLQDWDIVMYTRPGCHLCEQAWTQLEAARQRYEFNLRSINVDDAPELAREYGECVPVVVINGRVRFRGRINPVLLQRLLENGKKV
jgi:glutaredoxin